MLKYMDKNKVVSKVLKIFYPYGYVDSVFTIDYEKLYNLGYRGLIFDIDNTLVHHGKDSTPQVDELFRYIQGMGFKTLLLSNNSEERILRFMENIDSLYISIADKPNTAGYYKAVEMLDMKKEEVIVIGDQIFTDILGANRSGLDSILVKFIRGEGETNFGKRRAVENFILKFYSKNKSRQKKLGDIRKREDEKQNVKKR